MALPPQLQAALDAAVRSVPVHRLEGAVRELSARYRNQADGPGAALLRSAADVAAYAVFRLPATFAAIEAVCREVARRRPDFAPASILDAGAGPGTGAWAALQVWPEVGRVTLLERDQGMIRLGRELAAQAEAESVRGAVWLTRDLTASWGVPPADLTMAAYTIGEMSAEIRPEVVRQLWMATAGVCLIVEPGTPRGWSSIREALQQLHALGAHIIAPFPAGWTCVESERDWCHFDVRVPRTRLHRAVKEGMLGHEDEKFSYVVASRHPGTPIAARVIRHPQIRRGHIRLTLCTAEGVREIVVTRSNREAFRRAKDLDWGAAILLEESALFGLSER